MTTDRNCPSTRSIGAANRLAMTDVVQLWPMIEPGPNNLAEVRGLSTALLKRMWDDDSGRWEFLWDEIHRAMNERGQGQYVAV